MKSQPGPSKVRIAYCGPVARPGAPARGGYEAANRRLIDDLRLRGVAVLELPYPLAVGALPVKALAYGLRFAAIAIALVQNRRRFDVLHLTPLYRQFLYAEALLCLIAWGLGKRVLLDIRAGSFVRHYEDRGFFYRILADALMRQADVLALEGSEYLPFAQARRARPIVYLPNYVKLHSRQRQSRGAEQGNSCIRIVFLSRVVPEKGVETAIGALEALQAMDVPARLEIIGTGDNRYVAALAARVGNLPVAWSGPLAPEAVRARLAAAHFFVFPSRHRGEGHSNALTEAMAEGAVPVCSDAGFNKSVVGDAGRVLPAAAPAEDYARAIMEIGTGPNWQRLSQRARQRVALHFTGDVVLPDLIKSYHAAIV